MKTNQILTRTMGNFEVSQRTSDGMFNATVLLKQWNKHSGMQKKLDHFFDNNSTNEFIDAIISEENLDARNSVYVKSRASRGDNAGTWMHPLLFIDFAMWLNPTYKVKVLRFVYDQLIKFRNEAGDTYKDLTSAISRLVGKEKLTSCIQDVARGINFCVFGDHERNIRNKKAEEELMQELVEMQKKIIMLINEGFLRSFEDVMKYLRLSWRKKYEPRILTA